MSEREKLHRLLKFIIESGRETYSYDELIPAFKYGLFKKPNEKEIERLCAHLISEGLVANAPALKPGGITLKAPGLEAFYAGKYHDEEEEAPGYSSAAVLGALLIAFLVIGGAGWLWYIGHQRGQLLQEAEGKTRAAEQMYMQQMHRMDSLKIEKDSLQGVVNKLRKEVEELKKPATSKRRSSR
ncbi:MAG: hypothetical protein SH819_02800 [Cytophagales bacterium]|nr:hypothetical protein [Cytophagales bacterium]